MSEAKDDWWNCNGGVITLSAEDFDAFIETMRNPGTPTAAVMRNTFLERYRNRANKAPPQ